MIEKRKNRFRQIRPLGVTFYALSRMIRDTIILSLFAVDLHLMV